VKNLTIASELLLMSDWPKPCTARSAISASMEGAKAQLVELPMKISSPTRYTRGLL